MDTISSVFKDAAKANAEGQPVGGHLKKLKGLLGDCDFYNALEKSLGYFKQISAYIAAAEAPMSRALEVNQMSESERLELCLQVDVGL